MPRCGNVAGAGHCASAVSVTSAPPPISHRAQAHPQRPRKGRGRHDDRTHGYGGMEGAASGKRRPVPSRRVLRRSCRPALTDAEPIRKMWEAFSRLGDYEGNVIDTTSLDVAETVEATWTMLATEREPSRYEQAKPEIRGIEAGQGAIARRPSTRSEVLAQAAYGSALNV